MRVIAGLIVLVVLVCGGLYIAAGRSAPPVLSIDKPERNIVGQRSTIEIVAGAPRARFTNLTVTLEQNGHVVPLFSLDAPQSASLTQPDADHLRIIRPFGKQAVPELQPGPARIIVNATRPGLFNLRKVSASTSKSVEIRLEPPRIAVLSTHHYVNHGGSEMVLYRATPPDVDSGVRVGDVEYPGYPASGAGAGSDPAVKMAFFALLYDQDLNVPINAFARDDAGNEAKTSFVDNVFEKKFKHSRIEVDDRFFGRVVPEILEHSPELNTAAGSAQAGSSGPSSTEGDLVAGFLKVNGVLRRMNTERIASITKPTSAMRLWNGPFEQLGNSQVEASFADYRTYIYNGKEIDQQVHLGFDLAVTAHAPVVAANAGKVLNASWLGIYGNCIIIDHGMGVASLYGHLSSFDVKVGDTVMKGQKIGNTGMTGLAGGDHLHFTMLVNGHAVNPVEWWDPHWIQDRVDRKLQELGNQSTSTAANLNQPTPAEALVSAR